MPLREKTIALATRYESIGSLIRHYLASNHRMNVLWQTSIGEDAIRQCRKKPPRILITSPIYRDYSGVNLAKAIRKQSPDVRILLYAGILHRDMVDQMMAAQVHGIVAAYSPLPTLITAITVLCEGGCYFDGITESMLHSPDKQSSPLTAREQSVLRLVAEGFSTKEIASALELSVKTIEKFRERIMAKLGLHDAVKLTRYAIRTGISSLD
ncbi:MAG TPA: response regulator transcription factor [Chthoniobacterales bacterium]